MRRAAKSLGRREKDVVEDIAARRGHLFTVPNP